MLQSAVSSGSYRAEIPSEEEFFKNTVEKQEWQEELLQQIEVNELWEQSSLGHCEVLSDC